MTEPLDCPCGAKAKAVNHIIGYRVRCSRSDQCWAGPYMSYAGAETLADAKVWAIEQWNRFVGKEAPRG